MTLFLSEIITGQSRLEEEWWHLSAGPPTEEYFAHFRTLLSGQSNDAWGPAQKLHVGEVFFAGHLSLV